MALYKYLLVSYCHLNRSMYPHSFVECKSVFVVNNVTKQYYVF